MGSSPKLAAMGERAAVVARVLLIGVGGWLSANALWLALTANLTVGTAATALAGAGLLVWGIRFRRIRLRWQVAAAAFVAAVLTLSGFLFVYGSHDDADFTEDAVIVLGAAVHGSQLSPTLQGRLDTALTYRQRNPAALIVVSGGQGIQEDLPEAVAMAAYLESHGVPKDQIVVEDRATSTEENFAYSRALLDQRLPPGSRVAFVTDEFHVYRAEQLAAAAGLQATHVARRTPWYFWAPNYLREDLAVLQLWITHG